MGKMVEVACCWIFKWHEFWRDVGITKGEDEAEEGHLEVAAKVVRSPASAQGEEMIVVLEHESVGEDECWNNDGSEQKVV